jgi:uncharacterized membrane protein
MEWKDIAGIVGKAAPLLGTLVGGPAGPIVGALISTALGTDHEPSSVSQALISNPEAAVKLQQLQSDERVHLQDLLVTAEKNRLAADTAAIQAVNTTMQSEAASDHWPTYSWRPFIGFMFGAYVASMWLLPLFGKTPVTLGADLTLAIGGILGIASFFRGKAQADPSINNDMRG